MTLYFLFQFQVMDKKVLKYEQFLNEQLKPDLEQCLKQRDLIYAESAEYLSLRNSIEAIQKAELPRGKPLKTKVDLGCNFYAQAKISDPEKVFVDIGFGFFLEMTHGEALDYIEKKRQFLQVKAQALTAESHKLKANIKLVLEGLREIQDLSCEDLRPKQVYDPLS